MFCSFYPAVSVSEHTVLHGVTIPECRIGKDSAGSGHALTKLLPKHVNRLSKPLKSSFSVDDERGGV